ncbi:MAG: FAD-binding oxidoreductase [Candidatus Omnitrophica bacterium]|nr:FAD-binding oxidoreductase [Candidatus Omnitrophota bacterium]
MKTDVLIIGGGFAGLCTALALADRGLKDVVVIEQEKKIGGHASGRNAGMIRQSVSDPFLAKLAKEGRDLLSRYKGFVESGSLLLAKGAKRAELDQIAAAMKEAGVAFRRLSKKQAIKRMPLLEGADFEEALWTPSDGLVDIRILLKHFLKQLKFYRIPVLCGQEVEAIEKKDGVFRVESSKGHFWTNRVVNAAGAWAGLIGQLAGATTIPFKAYRRHLFMSQPLKGVRADWPFVWDLSHELYFRPVQKSLLMSPCDKKLFTLSFDKPKIKAESTDDKMKNLLAAKLKQFSKNWPAVKIRSKKAGLRTMAPGGRFIIGEDAKVEGFFWVAGLGGHGVTTCLSAGRLAATLVMEKEVLFAASR